MNRHAWLQKHPSPLATQGEFHWYPEAADGPDRELRASFVERVRGVEPPAVLWQVEPERVAWGQVFSATAPLDGRRYVGLVLSVVEGNRSSADLFGMLSPPPPEPWGVLLPTQSFDRDFGIEELVVVPRAVIGDVAGVARALMSGGSAGVDDPTITELPRWIASIARVVSTAGSAACRGVWCVGESGAAAGRAVSEMGKAGGGSEPRGAGAASVAGVSTGASVAGGSVGAASVAGVNAGGIVAGVSAGESIAGGASVAGVSAAGVSAAGVSAAGVSAAGASAAGVSAAGGGKAGANCGIVGAAAAHGAGARSGVTGVAADRVAQLVAAAWRAPGSREARAWTLLCELAAARGESVDRVGAALDEIDIGAALTAAERAEVISCNSVVDVLHAWGRGRLDRSQAAGTLTTRLADLVALGVLSRLAAGEDGHRAIAEARWYALLSARRRTALLGAVAQRTASLRAIVEAHHV